MSEDNKTNSIPHGFKLLNTLRGHEGAINRFSWSPDGSMIASPSKDLTIRIWDIHKGKSRRILKGHTESVYCVSWSPDGKIIASGGWDFSVQLWGIREWDIETKNFYHHILTDEAGAVNSVAWSPNGQLLAIGGEEGLLQIWNTESKDIVYTLPAHRGIINNLSWSPDGKSIASASSDKLIKIWDIHSANLIQTLVGHSDWVFDVSWSPDSRLLCSSSWDTTIGLWDINKSILLRIFEGHLGKIEACSFSSDSRLIASKSHDNTVRIWHCDTGKEIAQLTEVSSGRYSPSLAFHPHEPILATLGEKDTVIRIWELDYNLLLKKISASKSNYYVNAKVVLLGESGVGKSGLGIRMAEKTFRLTKSTHGAQFWQIPLPKNTFSAKQLDGNIQAELTLWDLAGQPDYHLIHQLFLDDTDAALLLFDCSDSTDPFRGVPYWAKVLKKQAPNSALKYLISSRCDVSPVTVDQREINSKLVEYELDDYFRTCAFTGEGVEELLQHILNNIPWDQLPRTSTPKLFQIIRGYLLEQKEAGKTLLSFEDIQTEVSQRYTEEVIKHKEIKTVINLLQTRGFIYFVEPTPNLSLVLLRPELINKYASSIIQAARQEGIGAISERDVICANLSFDGFGEGERLPAAEEKLILESTVELFIRRNLGFREMGRLIFPSQLNIRQEIPAE